jgi:hypothetical protein
MDSNLKIYEGEELKQKQIEGKEKMLGNKRKNAEQMMNENKNRLALYCIVLPLLKIKRKLIFSKIIY